MTTEHPQRARTGRISDENFINALNRRYALIRGRYETIEQEAEFVTGVAALIEAQDRIDSERALMRRVMGAIEIVARDIDPSWSAGQVRPIYPKRRDSHSGEIMRTGRSVLRKAKRPMTVREIAKAVAVVRGIEQTEAEIGRLDRVLHTGLSKRLGQEIRMEPGPPRRYFVAPRPSA